MDLPRIRRKFQGIPLPEKKRIEITRDAKFLQNEENSLDFIPKAIDIENLLNREGKETYLPDDLSKEAEIEIKPIGSNREPVPDNEGNDPNIDDDTDDHAQNAPRRGDSRKTANTAHRNEGQT
jgi:hypothetical protein